MAFVPVAVNTRMPALDDSPDGRNEGAYRMRYRLACPVTEIKFGFQDVYNGAASQADPFTLTASLDVSGTPAVSAFAGSPSKAMTASDAVVLTDAQAYVGAAGDLFFVRTGCVSTGANTWPLNAQLSQSGEAFEAGSGVAAHVSSGSMGSNQGERGYGPSIILGEPVGAAPIAVGGIGDSIFTSGNNGVGFVHIALNAHPSGTGVPDAVVVDTSLGGDGATSMTGVNKDSRWNLLDYCDYAVQEYAINDLLGGASLATMQGRLLDIGEEAVTRGIGLIDCTTFVSTGLDAGGEAIRVALNDWRRDGHPINPDTGVAVATGTVSALRAGETGHPFIGYLETADATETARNSGTRITELYDDGTHLNNAGHVAVAAAVRDALLAFINPIPTLSKLVKINGTLTLLPS